MSDTPETDDAAQRNEDQLNEAAQDAIDKMDERRRELDEREPDPRENQ